MAKKPELDDFRVPFFDGGKKLKPFELDDRRSAPRSRFRRGSKDSGSRAAVGDRRAARRACRRSLHAQRRRRVLLVLQGMDTSGKDGTIRAVFHEVDPLGLRIVPFKAPTPSAKPRTIFSGASIRRRRRRRTDDLQPQPLRRRARAARAEAGSTQDEFERRYRHIRQFEALLADSGTTIVKCFLHISKDEQRERLQARIDDPTQALEIRRRPISKRASSGTTIRRRIATRSARRRPNTRRGTSFRPIRRRIAT